MTTVAVRSRTLTPFLLLVLLSQCRMPPAVSPLVYVGATRTEVAHRPSAGCAFRYTVVNTFSLLDNDRQHAAIQAGFAVWQKLNPRVGFLELPTRAELRVRFDQLPDNTTQPVSVGLLGGSAAAVSALVKASDGSYAIILSDTYGWEKDINSLTKAIAYQTGVFLGMATSTEPTSVMAPLFLGQPLRPTRTDSLTINSLYATPCPDLTGVCFLPLKLKIGGTNALTTKTIKFDKQGTVVIKASGIINVGFFVGPSDPAGIITGPGGFSPAPYNLIYNMRHAALMYNIDNEKTATNELVWHYWNAERTFKTNGRQYIDLTFNINDNTQGDNVGYYDVEVDYQ